MTYAAFLLVFLVGPLAVLAALVARRRGSARGLPPVLRAMSPGWAIALLATIAVAYTTPWDNYLVATKVWWYDPALVTGVTLGWVPLEEYAFFVLQTVATGLWVLLLAGRLRAPEAFVARPRLRLISATAVAVAWAGSLALLAAGWLPANYLSLELAWALPPIALQLAVGADILWHHRRLVGMAVGSAAVYFSAADVLALESGTWTINPERSLGLLIGGVLPVEEAVFFLLTNILIVFGLVLGLSHEAHGRVSLAAVRGRLAAWQRQVWPSHDAAAARRSMKTSSSDTAGASASTPRR